MSALGLRLATAELQWAIVAGTVGAPVLVAADRVVAPKTFGEARWLIQLRDRLTAVCAEHKPTRAAIKGLERMPRPSISKLSPRIRAEGVSLVACQALGLDPEIITWTTISSRLDTKRAKKEYEEIASFRGIDWNGHSVEVREAIMVAAAMLPKAD